MRTRSLPISTASAGAVSAVFARFKKQIKDVSKGGKLCLVLFSVLSAGEETGNLMLVNVRWHDEMSD